jgi:hypothetical protein
METASKRVSSRVDAGLRIVMCFTRAVFHRNLMINTLIKRLMRNMTRVFKH